MPDYLIEGTKTKVRLDKSNFKAKGGEGSVYISGGRVYKVCEPGHMIPEGKFAELQVLDHPQIVQPERRLLNSKGNPVGYDMLLVPNNPRPLVQILTKVFREREGLTPQHMANLVMQIRKGIGFIHSKGCLQVDGNENNYMVTEDFQQVYFIDVNAYQTPNYPCDVINPSIRDWQCPVVNGRIQWNELSDYWSFGIISFWMFCGMHAFKIRHPIDMNLKTCMTSCMKANKSALDPEAIFPEGAVYYPFEDYIPGGKDGAFMQWYRAVFVDAKRLPAPEDYQSKLGPIVAKIQEIVGSNNFNISELAEFNDMIVGFYHNAAHEVVVTKKSIYIELFGPHSGSASVKVVDDPAIKADMRLSHTSGAVFARGTKLYSITMSK